MFVVGEAVFLARMFLALVVSSCWWGLLHSVLCSLLECWWLDVEDWAVDVFRHFVLPESRPSDWQTETPWKRAIFPDRPCMERFEENNNKNQQECFSSIQKADVGRLKSASAADTARRLRGSSGLEVIEHGPVTHANAMQLVSSYNLVCDCTDSVAARFFCWKGGKKKREKRD